MSNDTTFIDYSQPSVDAAWLNDINDHVFHDTPISPATTVHPASVIKNTPAGNIASTTVQDAINELDTEKGAVASPLSQFAATTSAQLAGVISDETGSGALVFANSPTLITPTLGTPTSGNLTNCTFPTLNQNTTGTASNGVPPGTIIDFAGTSAPTGYLKCLTTSGGAGLVSRTTYANLFTAIGTTWGSGDGSTTFQIPWFTADTVGVQANANVGTTTHGAVLDHIHNTAYSVYNNSANTGLGAGASSITSSVIATTVPTTNHNSTDNLPSGQRVLKCVKY